MTKNWYEIRQRGKFIRVEEELYPENSIVMSRWNYKLKISKPTHIIIGVHQEDERSQGIVADHNIQRSYLDVGLSILRQDSNGNLQLVQNRDHIE